jgi:hypothetical protein
LQYPQYQQSAGSVIHPVQPRYPEKSPKSPLSVFIDESSHGLLSPPHSNASPSLTPSAPRPNDSFMGGYTPGSKLQSINDRVTKPFDYTEGYHFLMKHLPIRCVYLITRTNSQQSLYLKALNIPTISLLSLLCR